MSISGSELSEVANSICDSKRLVLNQVVGQGAFKCVFKVTTENEESFALKVLAGTADSPRTAREIESIRRCNHPHISKLNDVGCHTYNGQKYDYMIEEFLSGGSLASRLENTGRLSASETQEIGGTLIETIAHLQELGLVHRDIKPDNIMFRDTGRAPVLVDFGLVRDLSQDSLTQTWAPMGPGTPYYSAPEQLNNQKNLIDWRTDQFSLGIMLSIAFFGQHPFQYPGEPDYSLCIVQRVANRLERSPAFIQQCQSTQFSCLLKMTQVWPVERFITPVALAEAWKNQQVGA